MIGAGLAPIKNQFRMRHILHRIAHRAGADAFQQRRHRAGMAQPRTVIDVVAAGALSHQLLKQVSLFVAALAEPNPASADGAHRRCNTQPLAIPFAAKSSASSQLASRNKADNATSPRLTRSMSAAFFAVPFTANQRHGEPLVVPYIVEAVTSLDAQSAVAGRAVASGHKVDGPAPDASAPT